MIQPLWRIVTVKPTVTIWPRISLIHVYPREIETYFHKKPAYKTPAIQLYSQQFQLEITQTSTTRWLRKQTAAHPANGTLLSNEQAADTDDRVDGSRQHCAKRQKQAAKATQGTVPFTWLCGKGKTTGPSTRRAGARGWGRRAGGWGLGRCPKEPSLCTRAERPLKRMEHGWEFLFPSSTSVYFPKLL